MSSSEDHARHAFIPAWNTLPLSHWIEMVELWKCSDNYITEIYPAELNEMENAGFSRAMNAFHQNKIFDIIPACNMEIHHNGEFANDSRLLRVMVRQVMFESKPLAYTSFIENTNDLETIINSAATEHSSLIFNAEICSASNCFRLDNVRAGKSKYKELLRKYESNLRKRCIINFWCGFDHCTTYNNKYIMKGLQYFEKALRLSPNFFPALYYQVLFELAIDNSEESVHIYENDMIRLHRKYPTNIQPINRLIDLHIQRRNYNAAAKFIRKANAIEGSRQHNRLNVTFSTENNLQLTIEYLKQCIEDDPSDYSAYDFLADIYYSKTHEYRKCLEVLCKAMTQVHDYRLFSKLFQKRHSLLEHILKENFWSEL